MVSFFINILRACVFNAGVILALCLCASLVLADPPAKPKNPGPLDIPDSQVLKMSIDQYIGAYEKKHNGNITELETRTLCYYYAGLKRNLNIRRALRLSNSRSRSVELCDNLLGSLSEDCEKYQMSAGQGTIILDYYAMLDAENEVAIGRLLDDLQNRKSMAHGTARHDYLEASKNLLNSAQWLKDNDVSWTPSRSIGRKYYEEATADLRKSKTLLNTLPKPAKEDFARQLKVITSTLNDD